MRLDPAQLAALSAVLRHGSFDLAANELNVTPSAISQRIRALEERAGTTLIIRAAPCRATAAGARLARHAAELSLLEADLARDLALSDAPGRVRLAVTADSLALFVVGALALHPEFLFEIVVDDQSHSADWLRRGEVSAAITDHAHPVQGCECRKLGDLAYRATASPGFVARHFPKGLTREALLRAPMMRFNEKDRLQHDWLARVAGGNLSPPCHHLPSPDGFVEAARLGLAWGLNPEPLVSEDLRNGTLVDLAPGTELRTPLYWQVRRAVSAALLPVTKSISQTARWALG